MDSKIIKNEVKAKSRYGGWKLGIWKVVKSSGTRKTRNLRRLSSIKERYSWRKTVASPKCSWTRGTPSKSLFQSFVNQSIKQLDLYTQPWSKSFKTKILIFSPAYALDASYGISPPSC